jgi:hypothetical protein
MPCVKHCSICGKAFKGSFFNVMAQLRRHRKQAHPKAHRESVKKTLKTKGLADPVIHVRRKLVNAPPVKSFKDFPCSGLIRVLDREKDKFPEFALYPRARNKAKIEKSLRYAGLKEEEKGKWVLRTDRFNIFVYT